MRFHRKVGALVVTSSAIFAGAVLPSAAGAAILTESGGGAWATVTLWAGGEANQIKVTADGSRVQFQDVYPITESLPYCASQSSTSVLCDANMVVQVEGGAGNDAITIANNPQIARAEVRASGGSGNDILQGGSGAEILSGDEDNDRIYGLLGNDVIVGKSGDDIIYAGPGDDFVDAGPGADFVSGSWGNDEIDADFGLDRVFGEGGNDYLRMRDGVAETISGGEGCDRARVDDNDQVNADVESWEAVTQAAGRYCV